MIQSESDVSANACLMVYQAPREQIQQIGRVYDLTLIPDGMVVGDSVDADIQVPNPSTLPCKGRVYLESDGAWYVENIGKHNNIYIDGLASRKRKLIDGDRVTFLSFTFRFLDGVGEESFFHRHLHRLVGTDALTGISNKRQLEEHLQKSMAYCLRNSRPFCLALLDLDNFSRVNNTYGHAAGDHVLKDMTDRIRKNIRAEDIFGRDGGEEFLIGLPGLDKERAANFVERLRTKVTVEPILYQGIEIPVTFSAGLTQWKETEDLTVLKDLADQQMYKAKGRGKNQISWEP